MISVMALLWVLPTSQDVQEAACRYSRLLDHGRYVGPEYTSAFLVQHLPIRSGPRAHCSTSGDPSKRAEEESGDRSS